MYKYKLSVLYMLISTLLLSFSLILIKDLIDIYGIIYVLFLRYFIAFIILFWIIIISGVKVQISLNTLRKFFTRSIVVVLSQYCLFIYLLNNTVLNGNLLFATGPVFIPIISMIFLKEKISRLAWICIAVSFFGVFIIKTPDYGIIDFSILIGLSSGLFNGASQIIFHDVSRKEHPIIINFITYGIAALFSFIPLAIIYNVKEISNNFYNIYHCHMIIFIMLSIIIISSQNMRSYAYKNAKNATSLSPFLYTTIIFTAVLGWIFFNNKPNLPTIAGSFIIIIGGILLIKGKSIYKSKILQIYFHNKY